jgi:hypothetical protein
LTESKDKHQPNRDIFYQKRKEEGHGKGKQGKGTEDN